MEGLFAQLEQWTVVQMSCLYQMLCDSIESRRCAGNEHPLYIEDRSKTKIKPVQLTFCPDSSDISSLYVGLPYVPVFFFSIAFGNSYGNVSMAFVSYLLQVIMSSGRSCKMSPWLSCSSHSAQAPMSRTFHGLGENKKMSLHRHGWEAISDGGTSGRRENKSCDQRGGEDCQATLVPSKERTKGRQSPNKVFLCQAQGKGGHKEAWDERPAAKYQQEKVIVDPRSQNKNKMRKRGQDTAGPTIEKGPNLTVLCFW